MRKCLVLLCGTALVFGAAFLSGSEKLSQEECASLIGGQIGDPIDPGGPGGGLSCTAVAIVGYCDTYFTNTYKGVPEGCPGHTEYTRVINVAGNTSGLTSTHCTTPCGYSCGVYTQAYTDCDGAEVQGPFGIPITPLPPIAVNANNP